jgi:2,4-dienoyl-CoA reductase-like NADH-dependent reductase (Old Yellow Enzyme family)
VTLANRLCKAAMTEGLADEWNRATARHQTLYDAWANGGFGVVLTGNVQVDRRYLERPGNVAVDGNDGLDMLARWAEAGTRNGAQLWPQVGHAGRQVSKYTCAEPVAPSPVPIGGPLAGYYNPPRALTDDEIVDVIARFASVCATLKSVGFTGVQIHGAHGYLLSSFLSPRVNKRSDRWGGPLQNRARIVLEVVRAVRAAVGPQFPVALKLNSKDFQDDGFGLEESAQVVAWLGDEGLDLLEVSGGTYEKFAMMDGDGDSTRKREAFFLDYAQELRRQAKMPMMVTGGFRSRAAMNAALAADELDMIGLGRPTVMEPDLGRKLVGGDSDAARAYGPVSVFVYYQQLRRLADGSAPDFELEPNAAVAECMKQESAMARALTGRPATPAAR